MSCPTHGSNMSSDRSGTPLHLRERLRSNFTGVAVHAYEDVYLPPEAQRPKRQQWGLQQRAFYGMLPPFLNPIAGRKAQLESSLEAIYNMRAVPALRHCNDTSAPTSINIMPRIHVMIAHGAHVVHDVYTRHNATERVKVFRGTSQ